MEAAGASPLPRHHLAATSPPPVPLLRTPARVLVGVLVLLVSRVIGTARGPWFWGFSWVVFSAVWVTFLGVCFRGSALYDDAPNNVEENSSTSFLMYKFAFLLMDLGSACLAHGLSSIHL